MTRIPDVADTPVIAGEGLSVAAQVAIAKNPGDPVAAVDTTLLAEVGVKTHGWVIRGDDWWKQHSTWVWAVLVGVDGFLPMVAPFVPIKYQRGVYAYAERGAGG
jgi:hypothetical protein